MARNLSTASLAIAALVATFAGILDAVLVGISPSCSRVIARIARIADPVLVAVPLLGVKKSRAVVALIDESVSVLVYRVANLRPVNDT